MMNVKKYIGLALLPMVFTACQEDTLVNDQAQGIYTLKATVDKTAPMSRAQVVLGGTSTTTETFHWNAGDEMMLLDVSNVEDISKHSFTISSSYDGNSVSADFTTSKALTEGHPIVAIYPTTFELDSNYGYFIQMDVAGHVLDDNSEASWIKYFSENMFMIATGTASEGMALQMQHLCSLLRVTYTNATDSDVKLSSITLNGDICTNRTFHAGDTSYDAGHGGTSDHGVRFANPVTVGAGETEDFYILTFAYFDLENNNWGGLTGFNFSYAEKSDASTPATYNGQQFVVSNLKAGSSYWFNITETANGIVWTKDVNQGEEEDVIVTISNTELSSALFNVLGSSMVILNGNGYAEMKESDVLAVTQLDLGMGQYTITSLAGIEEFKNLEYLICNATGLTTCDLSQNTALKEINLGFNQFTELDLSANTNLETIYLSGCRKMTSLNLDNCSQLERIIVNSCPALNSLNITNKLGVLALCYSETGLNFNLEDYPNLIELNCSFNGLSELDITSLSKLQYLTCGGQDLTLTMTAAQKEIWDATWSQDNSGVNIIVAGADNEEDGTTITIKNTELAVALQDYLGADKVSIDPDYGYAIMKKEDVLAVTELDFEDGKYKITSLSGIGFFVNLKSLNCTYMGLEQCDFSENKMLEYVRVQYNNLTTLDLSNCPNLNTLICSYMESLTSLNLTGCTKLSNLQAQSIGLTELNIPNPEAMNNFLTPAGVDIDLTPYINLSGLGLDNRNLENLDMIPENIKSRLNFLKVDNNSLTQLDLTEYTNLQSLNCSYNQIEELNITPLEKLQNLWCIQRGDINLLLTLTQVQLERLEQNNANWANGQNLTLNIVSSGNDGGGTSGAE